MPKQRRRCKAYPWCVGHSGPSEVEHHGRAQVIPAQGGRELRIALTADADGPIRVSIEVQLSAGGQPLEVVELDPAEVLQAAAALRSLALESREPVDS